MDVKQFKQLLLNAQKSLTGELGSAVHNPDVLSFDSARHLGIVRLTSRLALYEVPWRLSTCG